MTTKVFVSKKKFKRICKECGSKTHPVYIQEWANGKFLLQLRHFKYCRECCEFDKEVLAKDLLEFENPKMREEYVDAHTPK